MGVVVAGVSHLEYESIKDSLLFADAKFKKFESQMDVLTCLAYHFSLFTVFNVALIFALTTLLNRPYDHPLVMALRRNISTSLEQFVIFLGLYAYVLTQGPCTHHIILVGLSKSELILLANWFILARYLYAVGSLLEAKTGYNFRELGVILNATCIVALVLQIFGFSIFNLI